jgi:hypothetical protein
LCDASDATAASRLGGPSQVFGEPRGALLFLQRVLRKALIQCSKINLIERLVLVEAGENISDAPGFRIAVRLQTLRSHLFHHALHR